MKVYYRILFFLILISTFASGQDLIYEKLTLKKFNGFAKQHGCDTTDFGKYKVRVIKFPYYFLAGYQKNYKEKYDVTLYNINDSIFFKSYHYNYDNGNSCEIDLEKKFLPIFLYPDSTLGLATYTYDSPFTEGTCGACREIQLKIFRVINSNANIVFNFSYSDSQAIMFSINNKVVCTDRFDTKIDHPYNLSWSEADIYSEAIAKWIKPGEKLRLQFVNNETKKPKSITIDFFKLKEKYVFKAY